MDHSTEGVTLYAGFLFDVVAEYKGKAVFKRLDEMTSGWSASRPTEWAPMALYNELCDWVEQNMGSASIQKAGEAIGARAYAQMVQDGSLGAAPTPVRIMEELKRVASIMIRDPKNRQWQLLETGPHHVVMRREQTFNCMLQEGLLRSLVGRTGVRSVVVDHRRCTRRGDEFCEYRVDWL